MDASVLYFAAAGLTLLILGYAIGRDLLPFNIWTFLSILFLLFMPAIVSGVIYFASGVTPEVDVPSVLGMMREEAEKELSIAGLSAEVSGVAFSNRHQGEVVSQQPEAGKRVKSGRTVKIIISAREKPSVVPDLTGRMSDEAKALLEKEGLYLAGSSWVATGEASGMVIGQTPEPGAKVPPGAGVSVTISLGSQSDD